MLRSRRNNAVELEGRVWVRARGARRGGALLRPAGEAAVRLPERHRLDERVGVLAGVGELGERVLDELLLARSALDRLRPVEEAQLQLLEVAGHVVGDAEMDEREPLGLPSRDLIDRRLPSGDIDVRRRSRRHHRAPGQHPYARRVAGVQRPVRCEVADVVRGVAGRGEGLQAEDGAVERVDVLLGHGRELAPERVERVAVQPARAPLEPLRSDEVRCADRRDVHLQRGVPAHEHS
jgi:hypothetical protein